MQRVENIANRIERPDQEEAMKTAEAQHPSPNTAEGDSARDLSTDEHFMTLALEQAEAALAKGEFPVGCVIVHEGRVIVTGKRRGTAGTGKNETDHAEIVALRNLGEMEPTASPAEMTLYCTMEPCLMCYAAIILAGIGRIVYAYEDAMGGGTGCDLQGLTPLYRDSNVTIASHVLRQESLALFKRFFQGEGNDYWKGSYLAEYTLSTR